jgi:hypothetical protein
MATLYSDIYNKFLTDIKDDSLLDFTVEERMEILDGLLKKSISRFKACQTDLLDRTERIPATENTPAVEGQFNQDLTEEEMNILATIMRKYWLNDKIYNLELLQQKMTSKDWKLTSQAGHLLRLIALNQELDKEISRIIVDYSLYAYSVGDS